MFDIGSIGNALFGPGVGSLLESFAGNEQIEKLRQTSQTGQAGGSGDQLAGGGQGNWLRDLLANPLGASLELVYGKANELGISSEVQQQGYAPPSSWQQQFGGAVGALRQHFDLLDTSAGMGGRDGLIGRNDLEAALRNPSLPGELREACRFLLENPSAWNQLDVGAAAGEVDGFIGRCDLDAAARGLSNGAGAAGRPAGRHGFERDAGPDAAWHDGEQDCCGWGDEAESATGDWSSDYDCAGQDALRGSIWDLMGQCDGDMQGLLARLGSETNPTEIAKLNLQLQQAAEKRKLMFELVSTMSRLEHEMAKTALGNMGRA